MISAALFAAWTTYSVPVGVAAGKMEDGWLHVAEIEVHPSWQRHGIGREVMQALLRAGQQRGLAGATLTTDSIPAFDARFYASLVFNIVEGHSRPPPLVNLNAEGIAKGFNPALRAVMWLTF